MICASIARTRHKMMIAEYKAASEQGADLVELRLDYLRREPDFRRLLEFRGCPVIVSCRRPQDGGRYAGTEEQRKLILRAAIAAGVDYVDLEIDIADEIPRFGKTKRIVSYHNFETTPQNLPAIHAQLCALDPDIIKMATLAERPSDNVRMLQLVRKSKVPMVGFCMGELGVPSRILTVKFGAPFTYAAFNKERRLAPGQLSFEEMREIYHCHRVNKDTELFAVIGDPLAHTLSPHVHNAAFRHEGMNRVYVPFRVPQDAFDTFLDDVEPLGFRGFSVTIPHKEAAVDKVAVADGSVEMVGALNTLVRGEEGWYGYNTDYRAAMECLEEVLGGQPGETAPFSGKHFLVLGAGGVGRAVVFGLVRRGAIVTIANRTRHRGERLAKEAGCRCIEWDKRVAMPAEALVNCTPIGMFPDVNACPIPPSYLREGMIVFDTVYHPEQTVLIKEAKSRGCRVITGVDMFVRQAALQFQLFTEREAPTSLMTKVVRQFLSPLRRDIAAEVT